MYVSECSVQVLLSYTPRDNYTCSQWLTWCGFKFIIACTVQPPSNFFLCPCDWWCFEELSSRFFNRARDVRMASSKSGPRPIFSVWKCRYSGLWWNTIIHEMRRSYRSNDVQFWLFKEPTYVTTACGDWLMVGHKVIC